MEQEKKQLLPQKTSEPLAYSGKSSPTNYGSLHNKNHNRDGQSSPTHYENFQSKNHTRDGQSSPIHYESLRSGDHTKDDRGTNTGSRGDPNQNVETEYENRARVDMYSRDTEQLWTQHQEKSSSQKTCLSVLNLSYTVKERPAHWWNRSLLHQARHKEILKNLTMTFNKGEITAIVGSSGSGKTSLLDVISGREEGQVDGVVSYKHQQCGRPMMRQKASYVLQADRLLPTLTVKETLTYMALMKLPGTLTSDQIDRKVQKVISDMGLTHVSDSRIGGAVVRGVSGGERRRITIGVQLLKDPEILLLDEPTSGLDSFTAHHLVSTLVELAHREDKLVIMTIHQPRSDIVKMLDSIAILTSGQLAFLGPPSQLVPHFTSIGHPCPKNQNPCDVYIDITSVDRRSPAREKETTARVDKICQAFESSSLRQNIVRNLMRNVDSSYYCNYEPIWSSGDQPPTWSRVFKCLLQRMNVHLWRERSLCVNRLVQQLLFVPFLLLFIGRVDDDIRGIQDRMGLIYQAVSAAPYLALTNVLAYFPIFRETFYRESYDGMYSTATFLAAYYVHSVPFNIISSILFTTLLYWCAGFQNELASFAMFILVIIMMTQFGELMCVGFMGVIRPTQLASDTTALFFNTSAFFGSGLIRSLATMPNVLERIGYVAIHRYSTETIVANEFHNLRLACSDNNDQCVLGDDFLSTHYPGALDHKTRNFCVMGGYCVVVLGIAILMFRARGIPTLH